MEREKKKVRKRQTHSQADTQAGRLVARQTDRQTDTQADRQTHRQTHRQAGWCPGSQAASQAKTVLSPGWFSQPTQTHKSLRTGGQESSNPYGMQTRISSLVGLNEAGGTTLPMASP